MLLVIIERVGEAVVLRCVGRIVAGEEVTSLRRTTLSQAGCKVLVLDLAKVDNIDGAGMGLLAFLHSWTRAAGNKLQLRNPSAHVREVLQLTNLDSVLEISPSPDFPAVSPPVGVLSSDCCAAFSRDIEGPARRKPPPHRRSSKSPATKKKNTAEMTPFMVKKAALSLPRSRAETSECS